MCGVYTEQITQRVEKCANILKYVFFEIIDDLVYSGFSTWVRFNISGGEKIFDIFSAKRVDMIMDKELEFSEF